ncbi:MAG: hypothetical protein HY749_11785 [Gammaproteobacteria bacterium]|nr:hypothetical protein [Gammaproteobacteria bacterium]MBI5616251.1 hypothetical protein [Gammaproteobacteria bacterium]
MSEAPARPLPRDRLVADALFAVQLGCALLFGGSQALHMLHTTEGVSLSWFGFWEAFLLINFRLALRAHRAWPSRVTTQTVAVYALWTAIIGLDLAVMLVRGQARWTDIDTLTTLVAGAGVAVTIALARARRMTIADPIVRGWLAVFFKAVPQLTLAWNIARVGGGGLSPLGVVAGHVTICTRLGQLGLAIREAGFDRNRLGSALSEVANEASWIVATVVWLLV